MAPKRRPASRAARRPRPRSGSAPASLPAGAEARLLALAREISEVGRREPPERALRAALDALSRAYARQALLPRELPRAWAREQVRLALVEILARIAASPGPTARPETPSRLETRAWLLLAAREALAHEPAGAAPDRWRDVLELIGGAARPG
jgi:hypothetical protein